MKEIRYSFDKDDDIEKTTKQSKPKDFHDEEKNYNDDENFFEDECINDDFDDELDYLSNDESNYETDDSEEKTENDTFRNVNDNIKAVNSASCKAERDVAEDFAEPTVIKRKTIKPHKKTIKNIRLKKVLFVLTAIFGTAFFIAASPVFAVDKIVMNDLHYFTKDEICSQIGLNTGVNGIFFNKLKAENILKDSPYISSVKISFKLPDTMIVSVSENKICGYIKYLGSFLYIDRTGRVIDIKNETEESLPIIEGLKFSSFTINSEIPVENTEAFQAALSVSNAMCKYGVLDDAVSINVSDIDNLYAYINNVKVLLGDNSRMEEKIKTMAEAVKEISKEDRGTLDLTDLSKPIIFKYTT